MMDQGAVRNLEQIQEQDEHGRTPKVAAAAILVLGGACVVFATLALSGHKSAPPAAPVDPLGELVAQHGRTAPAAAFAAVKPTDLSTRDVTFPAILSDDTSPTTALAAVRGATPSAPPAAAAAPLALASPPPAADRLPVMPLPAQNLLEATPVITRPRDPMTRAASELGPIATPPPASTGAGHEGGYQLQVGCSAPWPRPTSSPTSCAPVDTRPTSKTHVNGRGIDSGCGSARSRRSTRRRATASASSRRSTWSRSSSRRRRTSPLRRRLPDTVTSLTARGPGRPTSVSR